MATATENDASGNAGQTQQEIEEAIAQSGRFSDALGQLTTAGEAAKGVFNTLTPAAQAFGDALAGIGPASIGMIGIEVGVFAAANKASETLNVSLNGLRALSQGSIAIAEEVQRATGFGAAAFDALGISAETAAGRFNAVSYQISQDIGKSNFEFYDSMGRRQEASTVLLGTAQQQMARFSDALLDDTRLYKFAAEGANAEIVKDISLTQEALKINAADVNLIFQNELSSTGRISGEALDKFSKAAAATAQLAGMSAEKVAGSMIDIMKDFNTFGAITEERAASLAVTMNNLGIDIDDVTRLAGKFQSFDSATQAMSQLAAVTGATLDTLELFKLANEDPEAFVVSFRDQLQAQGIEFDELNLIQQKQIASAFGLDPRMMQRLMNQNIESITGVSLGIEDALAGMTEAEADRILGTLVDTNKLAAQTAGELAKRQTDAQAASKEIAKAVGEAEQAVTGLNNQMLKSLGGFKAQAVAFREAVALAAGEGARTVSGITAIPAPTATPAGGSTPTTASPASGTPTSPAVSNQATPASPVAAPPTAPTPTATAPATAPAPPASPAPEPSTTATQAVTTPTNVNVTLTIDTDRADKLASALAEIFVVSGVVVQGVGTTVATTGP